ncbi:hypothetical protein [Pseudomonas fragariae (ex Marin et al. 2024)]|uniref:hypothetical protein n=1 Tax=Pseudomonas fragariae (ex Marin et al. 2024) TaxID=3080056 RepID=UPI003F793D8F
MNLSHKRIAEIRSLVSAGIQLGPNEAEDLLGHNDHLTELCEARARLVLRAESESETLRGLYQMHKQAETREMRDLKAEIAGLKTGYEAYERVNAGLRAENEALRQILSGSHEFILNDARTRHMCDETGQVSPMFPKRVGILAAIDTALSKDASHD